MADVLSHGNDEGDLLAKYQAEIAKFAANAAKALEEERRAYAEAARGLKAPLAQLAPAGSAASNAIIPAGADAGMGDSPPVESTFAALKSIIDEVVPSFAELKTASVAVAEAGFAALVPVLKLSTKGLEELTVGVKGLTVATGALSTAIGVATGGLTAVIGLAIGALKLLVDAVVGTAKDVLISLANPLQMLANGFRMAAAPTALMAGAMSNAIHVITGSLMGPFQQLASAVGPFVAALNPGLMRLFHQSVRDLMATFGVAFQPVIQHIISMFRALSATLTPLMHTLAPIVDDLMSRVEGVMIPMVGIVADAFRAMAPAIKFVTGIIADVVEAMRVVFTVIQSLLSVAFDSLRAFLGITDLKETGRQLQDIIHKVVRAFVLFGAMLARLMGRLDPFIDTIKKNLRNLEGQQAGTKAVPEHFRTTNLESLSKDLAVAAFGAQMGVSGRKASEAESLEKIVQMLEEVRKDQGVNLEKMIKDKLKEAREDAEKFINKKKEEFERWWNETGGPLVSQALANAIRGTGGSLVPGNANVGILGAILSGGIR